MPEKLKFSGNAQAMPNSVNESTEGRHLCITTDTEKRAPGIYFSHVPGLCTKPRLMGCWWKHPVLICPFLCLFPLQPGPEDRKSESLYQFAVILFIW